MPRFHRTRTRRLVALGAALVLSAAAAPALALGTAAPAADEEGTAAVFDGKAIDLSDDWEGARACLVIPDVLDVPECFATEGELRERVAELGMADELDAAAAPEGLRSFAQPSCSSWLVMYDGSYYTGSSLWFRSRGLWYNLASYGFNQMISSFKVGACQTIFADLGGGGGAWYPLHLSEAFDVDAVLESGWNNDFSSFYIY